MLGACVRIDRPPWEQVDFRTATLHVGRVKKGTPSTHPIIGDELRALRRLQREQEPKSTFVSTSERGILSRQPDSLACSRALAQWPSCRSRRTRTCSGVPAGATFCAIIAEQARAYTPQ
jgi:hypothetical protein